MRETREEKRRQKEKDKTQQGCTRMFIIHGHICFVVWELKPAPCYTVYAFFSTKEINK
jgi:hypothetical protein